VKTPHPITMIAIAEPEKKLQTVTLPTQHGDAEATRTAIGMAWDINYPWGADRFYGTAAQVKARMIRAIAAHDGEDN